MFEEKNLSFYNCNVFDKKMYILTYIYTICLMYK